MSSTKNETVATLKVELEKLSVRYNEMDAAITAIKRDSLAKVVQKEKTLCERLIDRGFKPKYHSSYAINHVKKENYFDFHSEICLELEDYELGAVAVYKKIVTQKARKSISDDVAGYISILGFKITVRKPFYDEETKKSERLIIQKDLITDDFLDKLESGEINLRYK